jgi:hypothetical protein
VGFFYKFGLLTCGFYVVMTIILEAGLWAVFPNDGVMFFIDRKHPAVSLGFLPGVILGFLWFVSFSAAWYIVYRDFRAIFPLPPN